MEIKIFSIPIYGGEALNEELNRFLRGHKVIKVEQQLVQENGVASWTFCVRYVTGSTEKSRSDSKKQRKDYKEILSAEAFAQFAILRRVRLRIAKEEGVPAFAVFSDEELAGLAVLEEITAAKMRTVKGIGEKKVEKYAERFIQAVQDEKSE